MKIKIFEEKDVRSQWDSIWEFDSIERNQSKLDYPEYKPAFELIKKDDKIVEAGVGLGKWLNFFHKQGYDITGVDYSQTAIDTLKSYNSSYNVQLGDVMHMPFDDESFDVYLSFGVLEHFEKQKDLRQAIDEMYRVLKKDGIALVTIPNLNLANFIYALKNYLHFNKAYRLYRKRKPYTINKAFFEYNYTPQGFLKNIDLGHKFNLEAVIPENVPLILKRFKRYKTKHTYSDGRQFNTNLNEKGHKVWNSILKKPDTSFVRRQLSHLCMYVLRKR